MEKNNSKNHMGFDRAAKENWYLTCLPVKPAPKVKIRFSDGGEHIYKGRNTIKKGNVAVIGRGCNSSFEMGEVIEVGVTGGGKSYMSNAQYVFASNPSQDEIKKMGGKIFDYQNADTVFKKIIPEAVQFEVNIPIVDVEIENLLFACCVLAHEKFATPAMAKKAKACLEKPKFLCSELFGERMEERFNMSSGPVLSFEFSGYYANWEKKLAELSTCREIENIQSLHLCEDSIRIKKCSCSMEEFIREYKEFAEFYNELVFGSALSLLIRGGFVNLLDAALRVHMPIEMFYGKLIELAQETGSTYCLAVLESHKAEYT